jgi:hypothetical protein
MLYLLMQKKKCKSCGKLNHKDVLFCWLCGSSFGQRICVSGHKNPVWVQYCLTCGKDRSLMSRPHSARELWFTKHPTKPSTYIPKLRPSDRAWGWLAVIMGTAILGYVAFLIAQSL